MKISDNKRYLADQNGSPIPVQREVAWSLIVRAPITVTRLQDVYLMGNRKKHAMPTSINYSFIQHFRVSADRAYRWCTDYDPGDLDLMHEPGKREINSFSEDTFLLTDTYQKDNSEIAKTKACKTAPWRSILDQYSFFWPCEVLTVSLQDYFRGKGQIPSGVRGAPARARGNDKEGSCLVCAQN